MPIANAELPPDLMALHKDPKAVAKGREWLGE